MRPGRIIALVIGCLMVLPAVALLFGGSALGLGYGFGRGDDGYFDTTLDRLETDGVALIAEDITFAADPGSPDWILDALDADARIRATSADAQRDVFIGIAREADVAAYLAGRAHTAVVDVNDDLEPEYRHRSGADTIAPPVDQDFWAVSAHGPGTQQLVWEASTGRWSAVVMNADGSSGVAVDVNVGAKAAFILPLAMIMIGIGAVLTAAAVALIVFAAHGRSHEEEAAAPVPPTPVPQVPSPPTPVSAAPVVTSPPTPIPPTPYPLSLTARLDSDLSRWMWLVKWFLAIPHFIVLVFLWIAFVVLTIVAGVAIVFTGRYPRGIFDFNVGVLRWSWRVNYYAATGGIGTDQYPPFSLEAQAGDPAGLDVAYPQQLSRWLPFVKWFLAIPHLIIIALLVGNSVAWFGADDWFFFNIGTGGGLLGLLVLIVGVVLLFTERYPPALFDLIVGLNRWVYRTVAYAALMTDTYPPFRLDQGGDEPIG